MNYNYEFSTNRILAVTGVAAINVAATNAWIASAPVTSTSTSVLVTVGYTSASGATCFEQYYLIP
ncbi:hypothetical protein IM774_10495 [Erysipelotrichaceae bacterium RD49]|nr:hypothetical protein [Erysipelotrichaceae bacterium RD49]